MTTEYQPATEGGELPIPDEIPRERLEHFGGEHSIIVWWTPKQGGRVNAIGLVQELSVADEIIDLVTKRPSMNDIRETRILPEDEGVLIVEMPIPGHPGYEYLDDLKKHLGFRMGFSDEPVDIPHPPESSRRKQ